MKLACHRSQGIIVLLVWSVLHTTCAGIGDERIPSATDDVLRAPQWKKIRTDWKVNSQIVNDTSQQAIVQFRGGTCDSQPAACRMVGIDTGALSETSEIEALLADDDKRAVQLNFTITDTKLGDKARLEMTTCFETPGDFARHGLDLDGEITDQLRTLGFVDQNCTGAAATLDASTPTWSNVSYDLRLPDDFPLDSQAIMGQFHGRPDPRIFYNPTTQEIKHLGTAEAFAACGGAAQNCRHGSVQGGPYDGWLVKSGGYPPIEFGFSSEHGRYW